jgi:uncharacterized protein involved in exopolysaccharide biosynthesis
MHGYRKTFDRHWRLYLLVPLLAAVAVGFLSVEKKSYQSTATIWVDYGAAQSSSLNLTSTSGETAQPATVEQGTLTELLSTGAFDDAVVKQAGVPRSMHSLVADSLPTAVTSAVPGPQVLAVTYTGSSALQAQKISSAVISQLQVWTAKLERNFDGAASRYTQTLYNSATKAVANAKAAVNAYHSAHRKSTPQNDQTYASLVSALAVANSSLASDRSALNQDAAQEQNNSAAATVSVLDGASLPTAPHLKMKTLVVKVIGAAIAGGLLIFLLVVLLTPGVEDGRGDGIDDGAAGAPNGLLPSHGGAANPAWTISSATVSIAGGGALPAGAEPLDENGDHPEVVGDVPAADVSAPQIRVVLGDGQRRAG